MAHLRILAFFLVLCCPIMVYADALLDALMNKDLNRARILIEQSGVDVKAKDKIGRTALMYTAQLGSTVLVKALLARGADVNAKDQLGRTALFFAALPGHFEVVQLLLNANAEVNALAGEQGTALIGATLGCHRMVVKELLDKGADKQVNL